MPITSPLDHPERVPVPIRPLSEPRHLRARRLPNPLTPLVGRKHEVAAGVRLLRDGNVRLVTLTGPGGTGKSRLAIRIAEELEQDFADGVAYVPLAPVRDPDLVIPTIARSLGVGERPGVPIAEVLASALVDCQLLLILDNLEQVVPSGPQLADLLASCPHLKLLATSQTRLRLSMEHVLPVPPLLLPERGDAKGFEAVAESPAVVLFVQRARQVRPDFALTVDNAAAVSEICWHLDGLPLAIELAAARLTLFSPEELLARLDLRLQLLTGGPQDHPLRLRTMANAIGWSYDLLDPMEQTLLRRLAVFLGGWTLEAAAIVSTAADGSQDGIFDRVCSLIDKSLVHRLPQADDAEPRFAMYESIRAYALQQLSARGEEEVIREAHAAYFAEFAQAADDGMLRPEPDHDAWRDRLTVERDNLRDAFRWLVGRGETEQSLRLAGALGHFWFQFSEFQDGLSWLEHALALPPSSVVAPRALALRWAGILALYQLDIEKASRYLQESLSLFQGLKDSYGTALALTGLGLLGLHQSDYTGARSLHEDALSLVQALEEGLPDGRLLATVCLQNLGAITYGLGDLSAAESYFEEALNRATNLGYPSLVLLPLVGLGNVVRDRGDHRRASDLFLEALSRSQERGNRRITAYALGGAGSIVGAYGEPEQAARLLGAAEALHDEIGVSLLPAFRASHERTVDAVRKALPEDRFRAAWKEGREMHPKHAVAEGTAALAHSGRRHSVPPGKTEPLGRLTQREHEVLRLLIEGHTDREIAALISVSPRTVGAHVTNLLAKLGVETRTAATTYALRNGLR